MTDKPNPKDNRAPTLETARIHGDMAYTPGLGKDETVAWVTIKEQPTDGVPLPWLFISTGIWFLAGVMLGMVLIRWFGSC